MAISNDRMLEGLYGLGVPVQTLMTVDKALPPDQFRQQLLAKGIQPIDFDRATALVEYRAGPSGTIQSNAMEIMRAMGVTPDGIKRYQTLASGNADPKGNLAILTEILGPERAGNIMIKATGMKPPAGTVWNPYRGDDPPNGTNVKYGIRGVITGFNTGADPMAGPANTRVAQPSQLPTPPTPVQQAQAASRAAGNPSLSGRTPGPGTGSGAGGAPPSGGGPSGTPPPRKLSPEEIKADIQARYGWGAVFMDIPEVAKILNDAASGVISAEEANRRWLGSDYYRSTSTNQRTWKTLLGTNPGDAAQQLQDQTDSVISKAQAQGITIDPARARQLAETSKSNGWSDQMVNAALASEVKWDPDGAKTGTMAILKGAVQNQLVPMSDQAMTQWAQAIVSGAQTIDDFQAYLKDQAKSLFPTMANYLDTTPGGTVKTYLDPYAQTIGKTLGTNPADIDWMDPKWYRFVNQIDPKTGDRGMMNLSDVSRALIADPQYGYDQTAGGKQQKAGLARTILEQWGYVTPSGAQNGDGF